MKICIKYSLNAKHAAKIIFADAYDYNKFNEKLIDLFNKVKYIDAFEEYKDDFIIFMANSKNKAIKTNSIITVKYYTEEFNAYVMALALFTNQNLI